MIRDEAHRIDTFAGRPCGNEDPFARKVFFKGDFADNVLKQSVFVG